MTPEPALDAASALIDLLVRAAGSALRDRLVLETGLAAAGADSGALWRREASEREWRPSVERGRRGGRFEAERATRRALESARDPFLPGFAIVRAEVGGRGVALVLAGALDDASGDALEALLACFLLIELADPRGETGPAAPLPAAPVPVAPTDGARGELRRIEHDVRNALTSLMATQQVLERYGADLAPAERQGFVEAVNRECERTGAILARGLVGGAAARAPECSAAEIAIDVLALERAGLERAGCTVDVVAADEARALAPRCGADSFSRIVRNLVSNAREAAIARGLHAAVVVELVQEADGVLLTVRDAAGGLPDVALPALFADGFSAEKCGGTGQGLAVVRALALDAGGAIRVCRLPFGATFEVWVPASALDVRRS